MIWGLLKEANVVVDTKFFLSCIDEMIAADEGEEINAAGYVESRYVQKGFGV